MDLAIRISVALSNVYPEQPATSTEQLLADCVHQCYYSPTCATFFYDFTLHLCTLSEFLCSIESQSMIIKNNSFCFEWKHDGCWEAWSFYRPTNRCLQLQSTEEGQTSAKEICQSFGAQQVIIKNMRENIIVKAVAVSIGGDLWIGLKDIKGVRTWVDGTLLGDGFSYWDDLQPKEGGGYCHVAKSLNGKWKTVRCNPGRAYICEKAIRKNYTVC